MAKAKLKPECAICFDEEGSYGCVRPAHEAYGTTRPHRKDEKPVTKEILATSIIAISDAVKKLYDSGLNRRAVVALIADDTKLGKGTIDAVLDSLLDLRKTYTK
jgi:hypothetical protein